jgi:hypothetical protein
MSDLCRLIWSAVIGLFRSRAALQAEVLFLRHQLNVLRRKSPRRVALNNIDRLVLTGLYYLAPQLLDALKIVKPETVIRWHRAGFRAQMQRELRIQIIGNGQGNGHKARQNPSGLSGGSSGCPVPTLRTFSVGGSRRFHQPPPSAWNRAAVSERRAARACTT